MFSTIIDIRHAFYKIKMSEDLKEMPCFPTRLSKCKNFVMLFYFCNSLVF